MQTSRCDSLVWWFTHLTGSKPSWVPALVKYWYKSINRNSTKVLKQHQQENLSSPAPEMMLFVVKIMLWENRRNEVKHPQVKRKIRPTAATSLCMS